MTKRHIALALAPLVGLAVSLPGTPPEDGPLPRAYVDGAGWTELTLDDFINVNGDDTTWASVDGEIRCTGKPIGGAKSKKRYENFELVVEWMHENHAGNSGVFLWCPDSAFEDLKPGQLPRNGIEVQVLDLGYEENWLKGRGKHSDWFTSHGDVFPVGASKMTPFTPGIDYTDAEGESYHVQGPTDSRSFPTGRHVRPHGEWNHYYVRAINGEVRLWVNGEEVNGGTKCEPAEGWLALEAEGAPVRFRNLRIRELP